MTTCPLRKENTAKIAKRLEKWADERDRITVERVAAGKKPLDSTLLRVAAEYLHQLEGLQK